MSRPTVSPVVSYEAGVFMRCEDDLKPFDKAQEFVVMNWDKKREWTVPLKTSIWISARMGNMVSSGEQSQAS